MEAAIPMQVVATSQRRNRMVSMMPRPAEMDPPGELMYIWMSDLESSLARKRSCATTTLAIWSSTTPPIMMMRSLRSRE